MAAATILDVPGPHTVDEWLALDLPESLDRWRVELLGGNWLVTGSPGLEHQFGGDELQSLLMAGLRAAGRDDLVAVTGMGVALSPRYGLEPDIMICPRKLAGRVVDRSELLLAVEIWSPGNRRAERVAKKAAFERSGVPYWWEIWQDAGGPARVETFHLVDGQYQPARTINAGDGPVTVSAAPVPVPLDVASLRLRM